MFQQLGTDLEASRFSGHVNGKDVLIESMVLKGGNTARVEINGHDYAINRRGFNIVVYDNEDDCMVDSVSFDTHTTGIDCYRS